MSKVPKIESRLWNRVTPVFDRAFNRVDLRVWRYLYSLVRARVYDCVWTVTDGILDDLESRINR